LPASGIGRQYISSSPARQRVGSLIHAFSDRGTLPHILEYFYEQIKGEDPRRIEFLMLNTTSRTN
jgi:hypothetical protein